MRKLLLVLLLSMPVFSIAQEYSEVIQVPEKSTDQLFVSAREWFAVTFNSANDVLQMEDAEAGKLIGKGSASVSEYFTAGKGLTAVPVTMTWNPNFTIKIEVREGRYKCDITDVVIKSYNELIGSTSVPFSRYTDQRDYLKNASNPEWLKNNPPRGMKMNKSTARTMAQSNQATCNLIAKVEDQLQTLLDSLENAMKKEGTNDDW